MRADQLLVERGMAASRSQAVRLIAGGLRWRLAAGQGGGDWRSVGKNRDDLPADAELELLDAAEARYVSRGGLKLEGALRAAGIDVQGRLCLDVGQSTGGFTDCLLQHGAAGVIGVDVGHGQVHPQISADGRVCCIEGVNARSLKSEDLIAACEESTSFSNDLYSKWRNDAASRFDFICGDLSFISLTLVLPALVPLLRPASEGGALLMLVKPQFELQPGQVGKGGVVREPALHAVVEQRIRDTCAALGLAVRGWFDSPIAGGDGNREFFVHAERIG